MAGIFGFLKKINNFDSLDIIKSLLEHADQNFKHSSNYDIIDNGTAGLGFSIPSFNSAYPLKNKNGNYYFQLFGEIYLPDGVLLSLDNFEQQFLYPFLKKGNSFLQKLDGAFVFSLYNKRDNTFILCNDPFGNFALHYSDNKNIFVFSSQMYAITRILKTKRFDTQGLSEYLGLGFSLNGNTYYSGIKRLQPAEIIKVSKRNLSSEKYYIPQYKYDAPVKENTKLIKNSFVNSIEKRLNNYNRVGAALTGGYDSRVTWAVINHLNKKNQVKAFTHGLKESRDITIAIKIANTLHLNHQLKIFDDQFIKSLPALWNPFVRLTEGLIPITNAHDIKSWELGKKNYRLLLDSHGGALYRRQFMKVAERRIINSVPLVDQIFEYVKSPLLNLNLLKDDYKHAAITNSKIALKEYFDSIDHIENTGDKIDLFYIHQLSANRYSLAGNAQMNWVMLAHPFLSLDSFKAVQKIPLLYRKNQYVYRYIVKATFKKLKSFYLENMGLPAPYFGFTYFRYLPMIYELLLQKTVAKQNKSIYKKISLRKFATDYDLFFRINFKQVEEILLRENKLFFDIIDKKRLEQLLKSAKNNYSYKLSALSNLITFKLFLDIFTKTATTISV